MTPNELVAVYRKANTQDEYGELSQARTLVAEFYARPRALSGSERDRGDQREDYSDYRFHDIRYRSDLLAGDILVWNGSDFNITFIQDNGPKSVTMYIDARKGGAQ